MHPSHAIQNMASSFNSPPSLFQPAQRKIRPLKIVGPYRLVILVCSFWQLKIKGRTLGQGSTGKVKLAVHENPREEKLACKILPLPNCLKHIVSNIESGNILHITNLEEISVLQPSFGGVINKQNQKDYDKAVRLIRECSIMMLLQVNKHLFIPIPDTLASWYRFIASHHNLWKLSLLFLRLRVRSPASGLYHLTWSS